MLITHKIMESSCFHNIFTKNTRMSDNQYLTFLLSLSVSLFNEAAASRAWDIPN